MVKVTKISKEELHKKLSVPYNAPAIGDEEGQRKFHDEYWHAHRVVKEALSFLGRCDYLGGADYCMNEDWYLSRGLSVQLTSEKMVTPALVSTILRSLCDLEESYSVYVDHGLIDLDDFFLFVERHRVFAFCDSKALIDRLGLVEGS